MRNRRLSDVLIRKADRPDPGTAAQSLTLEYSTDGTMDTQWDLTDDRGDKRGIEAAVLEEPSSPTEDTDVGGKRGRIGMEDPETAKNKNGSAGPSS